MVCRSRQGECPKWTCRRRLKREPNAGLKRQVGRAKAWAWIRSHHPWLIDSMTKTDPTACLSQACFALWGWGLSTVLHVCSYVVRPSLLLVQASSAPPAAPLPWTAPSLPARLLAAQPRRRENTRRPSLSVNPSKTSEPTHKVRCLLKIRQCRFLFLL